MNDRWTERIDQITAGFRAEFGELPGGHLNWKPDPAIWSIAQNIDHLMVINNTYFPILQALRKGTYKTPAIGKIGFLAVLLGRTVLKAVQPDRRKKMKTFPLWEPATGDLPANILVQFEAHQASLKQELGKSLMAVDPATVISSPANHFIVYKLETAFDIMLAHEQRHFEQARDVRNRFRKFMH